MAMVVLGLGSNKGDRAAHLRHALQMLSGFIRNGVSSPVYESAALLPEDAPASWNVPFFNMALRGETLQAPPELLDAVKAVERAVGRTPGGHWGPREIDIDILAYDNCIVREAALVIPHPELTQRDFALIPLADIAPDWVHPLAGETARGLAGRMRSTLIRRELA